MLKEGLASDGLALEIVVNVGGGSHNRPGALGLGRVTCVTLLTSWEDRCQGLHGHCPAAVGIPTPMPEFENYMGYLIGRSERIYEAAEEKRSMGSAGHLVGATPPGRSRKTKEIPEVSPKKAA